MRRLRELARAMDRRVKPGGNDREYDVFGDRSAKIYKNFTVFQRRC
jgi:hypothetical protein